MASNHVFLLLFCFPVLLSLDVNSSCCARRTMGAQTYASVENIQQRKFKFKRTDCSSLPMCVASFGELRSSSIILETKIKRSLCHAFSFFFFFFSCKLPFLHCISTTCPKAIRQNVKLISVISTRCSNYNFYIHIHNTFPWKNKIFMACRIYYCLLLKMFLFI